MGLHEDLRRIIAPERVLVRPLERYAYANDASFYRLVPQAVVQPQSIGEVQALMGYCRGSRTPLTFRAAGTSLSGQAITDGVLVDVSKHWSRLQIEAGAERVRLQPGIIGGHVNRALRPHGRRFGPDPASIDAAMVGGILANNSSGMCCGVTENAYRTVQSLRIVLPDGTEFDTAWGDADKRLRESAPDIYHGLVDIRRRILDDRALSEKIRRKYTQKNTTGYSMNAFLDFQEPVELLKHIMIGSEGTLGFMAEAVLDTLPDYPLKLTGLLFFPDVPTAGEAIVPLRESGARALEIMDRAALRSIERLPGCPAEISSLAENSAAILVEYQCRTKSELEVFEAAAARVCRELRILSQPQFTTEASQQTALWSLRKGIFPSIGAMRASGTSVMIEDVAFPLARLAEAITDLQALFRTYGYDEAVIFGHAKDGNLHFVITQSFAEESEIQRYDGLMQSLVDLVVGKYDGALKAEHGTGRNVAPFVAREWGEPAYALMKEIKRLFDPDGYLNPDVLVNPDPQAHIKNLKPMPTVEAEVDRCTECGFCESHCPSRRLTLTPRQRIVLRRAMANHSEMAADPEALRTLAQDYRYAGLDTCAADGLCAPACPVKINTGDLVKRLRMESASSSSQSMANFAVQNFALLEAGLRTLVAAGHGLESVLGAKALAAPSQAGERLLGRRIPKWNAAIPHTSPRRFPKTERDQAQAVYFPACLSRVMGRPPLAPDAEPLSAVLVRLAKKAGIGLWIPSDATGLCCGMPFSSKGYTQASENMLRRTLERFWEWSDNGRLPVVIDASSCAYTLLSSTPPPDFEDPWRELRLMDAVIFAHEMLLPRLKVEQLPLHVTLHPNCALRKMNAAGALTAIAQACASEVSVPVNLDCCGFAGDRGLLYPELTRSATEREAEEILAGAFDGYYSSNLTCEMGMALATGKPYRSILYLLDEASS